MNTPALTQYDRDLLHAYDDWVLAQRDEREAAMARYDCPECGSIDGMVSVWREEICDDDIEREGWYCYPGGCDHYLYRTCWACNRQGIVPEGYKPVDAAWIRAWLARPCQCNDCRRERGEPYWQQKWPLGDDPNEMELVIPEGRQGGAAD